MTEANELIAKLRRATRGSGIWESEITPQVNMTFNDEALIPSVFRAIAWLRRTTLVELFSELVTTELAYLNDHTNLLDDPPVIPEKIARGRVNVKGE